MITVITNSFEPLPRRMSDAGRSELACKAGKAQELLRLLPKEEQIARQLQPIEQDLRVIAAAIPLVKKSAVLGGLSALSGVGLYAAGRASNRREQGNICATVCAVVAMVSSLFGLSAKYIVETKTERVQYAMNHTSLQVEKNSENAYPLVGRAEMQGLGFASTEPGKIVSVEKDYLKEGKRKYLVFFPEGKEDIQPTGEVVQRGGVAFLKSRGSVYNMLVSLFQRLGRG